MSWNNDQKKPSQNAVI